MIRVVFGVNDFLVGGMQRQLIEQCKRYDPNRFSITLITLFQFEGKDDFYHKVPPHITVHKMKFKNIFDIGAWKDTYVLLKKIKPDIVVSSLFFSNLVFRVLKPFFRYVCFAREHNTYVEKPLWQRLIDRALSPFSKNIIAVSSTVAQFTARQEGISLKKFKVIHNGIDVQAVQAHLETLPSKEELRTGMGLTNTGRVFLNVSRLMPQKNHRLLIEGFLEYHKENQSDQLVISGDGPLRDELEKTLEKRNAKDYIHLMGHHDEVWPFYKMADVYISTSTIEGFSNSMLEAMASGLPVVSTKTAGTDELIEEGHNGFFVEESAESVSHGSKNFATAGVHMGANAIETAKKFDISKTVEAYEELFASVTTAS